MAPQPFDGTGPIQKGQQTRQEREQRPSRPGIPADVFTALQFVSVGATLLAIALLVMTLARYGWEMAGG